MANLYTTFTGLQADPNDVLEAELILQQILQAQYPDMDLREGTALRDKVIRPLASGLALLKKSSDYYFVQNTIKNIDDQTPDEILDSIMSNWFINRITGTYATISARLFFARPKNVSLPSSVYFSTDNTLRFFPASNLSFTSAQMTYDVDSQEYYIDLTLGAENPGTDYNISSGSLLYFTNFDPYFLHGEINFLQTSAGNTETNTEFISRSASAISTRNLINIPSIDSILQSNFTTTPSIQSIGMGDPEMVRDFVQVTIPSVSGTTWLHLGGVVDVYCRVPLSMAVQQFTADSGGNILITAPAYNIQRSQVSGGSIADSIPFLLNQAVTSITRTSTTATVTTPSPHGYSTGTLVTISGALPAGYNGTFTIVNTGANTFTYTVVNTLSTPATGTILAGVPYPYTIANLNTYNSTVTLVQSGNIVTGTSTNHGYQVGRYVKISGANQVQYNGTWLITAVSANTFTYTITGSPASPATGVITANYVNQIADFGFSSKQALQIAFGVGQANQSASFTLYEFNGLNDIESFMIDPTNKVLCGDYLGRGFNIYLLDFNIIVYNGPTPDQTACALVIETYLAALIPGQTFVMGDVISALSVAGITGIQTPIALTYKYYHRDLLPSPMATGTVTDYLDPADRTAVFMLNSVTTSNLVV